MSDQEKLTDKAIPGTNPDTPESVKDGVDKKENGRKHILRPKWLRIIVKTIFWIIIGIALLPVLLYIPPVQTFVKDVACKIVYDKTGMKVNIGLLRLKFPVDIELADVSVVPAPADTMVKAKSAIVDVKLLPLLKLDVQVNKLKLLDGYYRMVSPDSSMIMAIKAGLLQVDSYSSVNIAKSEINLGEAILKNGDVSLYMNVWKQQSTPPDSTSIPFIIRAGRLDVENITFGMSMLPTIDTLRLQADKLELLAGNIDLRSNKITASRLWVNGGDVTYLTPTPQYIATHPAPVDTISVPSAPMIIEADSISLDNFKALYAVKGARPQQGFDPSYMKFENVGIGLRGFYNEASTVVLPITRLAATERSGLNVTKGSGTVRVDSTGLALKKLDVVTSYSNLKADAAIPFALMEMQPEAAIEAKAEGSIGIKDMESFMPSLKTYLKMLGRRVPLRFAMEANGTLANVDVPRFEMSMVGLFSVRAGGFAQNALQPRKMIAALDIDGELMDAGLVNRIMGNIGVPVPRFKIKGKATANRNNYGADIALLTSDGDISARGKVGLTSERYEASVDIRNFNLIHYLPGSGLGKLTAKIDAHGAGFNPVKSSAATEIEAKIRSLQYNGKELNNIAANVNLHDSHLTLEAESGDEIADFSINGEATLHPDDYVFDVAADIRNVDLKELGIDTTTNRGSATFSLRGSAKPEKWIYDIEANLDNIDWQMGENILYLPHGVWLSFNSDDNHTNARVESLLTSLDFKGEAGLRQILTAVDKVMPQVNHQIETRSIDIDTISRMLPSFVLEGNASGRGLMSFFLRDVGVWVDTLGIRLTKDSLINGEVFAYNISENTLTLDTITLDLHQRGKLLDYALHIGNSAGTLDEFADVNLKGYLGENRLSAYLIQHNIAGEMGYRLGFTAAVQDDNVMLHFTPRKATIAYMPWQFNADNFVDYDMLKHRVSAKLEASSDESSIRLMTEPVEGGEGEQLRMNLDNIHVEDFMRMVVNAPDVQASVNSDLTVRYDGHTLQGSGTLNIDDLRYESLKVGSFDLDMNAGVDLKGNSMAEAALRVNGTKAMTLTAFLENAPEGIQVDSIGLSLTKFPLSVANAFIGPDVATLGGSVDGEMSMSGDFTTPKLNGYIAFDNVKVFLPIIGSSLRIDDEKIDVAGNVLKLQDMQIWGANNNPVNINGIVNAEKFSDIKLDLGLDATNFQVMNNDRRAKSDLYGKLFLTMNAYARGTMNLLDVGGNLTVLGTSDVTYNISDAGTAITQVQDENIVKFVNFNDTTQVLGADSLAQTMAMRINASVTLQPGVQATVNLSTNGTDKAVINPSGTLNYFQNYMGDMRLNGQLVLGEGFVRYNIPVVGEKMFTFNPASSVTWGGDLMNPKLNISATDDVKVNVAMNGGNSHLVNFLIGVSVANTLSDPKITFDLSTDDDMSIQNELQGMTPDQRSTQAMNILLYGQYTGPGTKTIAGPLTGNLYSFLASQVNSWAAKNIRGVDLSFGVDQYDKSENGQSSTTTTYSYQVSKSLFNNRFKISVGGNYDTDSSADDIADNLLSDVSFEYMLRQTGSTTMLVKLFRQSGYESILEGQIIETGVGFVLKRKLNSLWRFFKNKHRQKLTSHIKTSQPESVSAAENDTIKGEDNSLPVTPTESR